MIEHNWTKDEAQIIKRLWADDAGRVALNMIVTRLAALHQMSFDPNNTFQTAYNEGRRSVGHDLMRVINTPLDKLFKEVEDDEPGSSIRTATERAAIAAAKRAHSNAGRARR